MEKSVLRTRLTHLDRHPWFKNSPPLTLLTSPIETAIQKDRLRSLDALRLLHALHRAQGLPQLLRRCRCAGSLRSVAAFPLPELELLLLFLLLLSEVNCSTRFSSFSLRPGKSNGFSYKSSTLKLRLKLRVEHLHRARHRQAQRACGKRRGRHPSSPQQ